MAMRTGEMADGSLSLFSNEYQVHTLSVSVLGVMNIEGHDISPYFRMPGSIWNIVIKTWIEEVVSCVLQQKSTPSHMSHSAQMMLAENFYDLVIFVLVCTLRAFLVWIPENSCGMSLGRGSTNDLTALRNCWRLLSRMYPPPDLAYSFFQGALKDDDFY